MQSFTESSNKNISEALMRFIAVMRGRWSQWTTGRQIVTSTFSKEIYQHVCVTEGTEMLTLRLK